MDDDGPCSSRWCINCSVQGQNYGYSWIWKWSGTVLGPEKGQILDEKLLSAYFVWYYSIVLLFSSICKICNLLHVNQTFAILIMFHAFTSVAIKLYAIPKLPWSHTTTFQRSAHTPKHEIFYKNTLSHLICRKISYDKNIILKANMLKYSLNIRTPIIANDDKKFSP